MVLAWPLSELVMKRMVVRDILRHERRRGRPQTRGDGWEHEEGFIGDWGGIGMGGTCRDRGGPLADQLIQ